MNLALAAISRQALSRAKRARLVHCPGTPYFGSHLVVETFDGHQQPAFLSGPGGEVILFASVPEAEAVIRPLMPDLELEVDDYCLRAPAMILP